MTNLYKVVNYKATNLLFFIFILFTSIPTFSNPHDTLSNTIKTQSVSEKYPDLQYDSYAEYLKKEEKKNQRKKEKKNKNIENDIDYDKVRNVFKIIGWILIAGIVIAICFFIYKNKGLNLFNNSNKTIINDADIEKHIHEVDIDTLLQNALKNNEKELVIRFYFLKFLKKLAQKNYIKWHADKTNTDYFYEIKNAQLKTDFEYASYLYTYIWYGKFEITPELYEKAQNHFKTIIDRY